jgi:acetyl-CoA C-acetyltransferase
MHGIAEAVARCRAKPGSWGFVSANGGYLTKHSFGVYSTVPAEGWARVDPATYQTEVDAQKGPHLVEKPEGEGMIEACTVIFDRGAPGQGTVIGRLATGERFLSVMRDNLEELIDKPVIGRRVTVTAGDPVNVARLA